jgi:hypothetical protein
MDTKPSLQDQLEAELGILQEQEDRLADFFRKEGIKGKPHFGNECPIANYLREKIGYGRCLIQVGETAEIHCDNDYACSILPSNCRGFIAVFDKHQIPDLIEA